MPKPVRRFKYEVTVEQTYYVIISDDIPLDDVDDYLTESYEELGTLESEDVTSIECIEEWYE